MKLPVEEQCAVDRAQRDNEGWVMPNDMTAEVRALLSKKGLIRYWQNRWQLTPLGFSHTPTFRRNSRVIGPCA